MGLNVGESGAVNRIINHLAGAPDGLGKPIPSRAQAIDALALLADGAEKRLLASHHGVSARALLERHMPGQISPRDPAELGAWLLALPSGSILVGAKGLGWQLNIVTTARFLIPPLMYSALTTMSGEAFRVDAGHPDLAKLAAADPFTVLALGPDSAEDGAR